MLIATSKSDFCSSVCRYSRSHKQPHDWFMFAQRLATELQKRLQLLRDFCCAQAKAKVIETHNLGGGSGATCNRSSRAIKPSRLVRKALLRQSCGNEFANHIDGEEVRKFRHKRIGCESVNICVRHLSAKLRDAVFSNLPVCNKSGVSRG